MCYFVLFLLAFFLSCTCSRGKWMDSTISHTFVANKHLAFRLFSSLDRHPTWSPWLEKVDYHRDTGLSAWSMSYLGLRYSWRANNTIVQAPNIIQWESLDGLPNRGKVEFSSVKIPSFTTKQQPSSVQVRINGDSNHNLLSTQHFEGLKIRPASHLAFQCHEELSSVHDHTTASNHHTAGSRSSTPPLFPSDSEEDREDEELTMKMTISYDLPDAAALVLKGLGPIARNFISNMLLGDLKRFQTYLEYESQLYKQSCMLKSVESSISTSASKVVQNVKETVNA